LLQGVRPNTWREEKQARQATNKAILARVLLFVVLALLAVFFGEFQWLPML
jgi:hypothetical protein